MNTSKNIDELLEDFIELLRKGEKIDINTFADRYPEHTAELLELLPLISDMERLCSLYIIPGYQIAAAPFGENGYFNSSEPKVKSCCLTDS